MTEQEITEADWREVDEVLCPCGIPNNHGEWARYADTLRTALAQQLANYRAVIAQQIEKDAGIADEAAKEWTKVADMVVHRHVADAHVAAAETIANAIRAQKP